MNTQFLGLRIDSNINWHNPTERKIAKLRGACYAVRSVVHVSKTDTFKSIHYAYFHCIIQYRI